MAALAVCNNVTPVDKGQVAEVHGGEEFNVMELGDRQSSSQGPAFEKRNSLVADYGEPQLEASSPDEVALVKFGYQLKMRLVDRTRE